MRWSIAVLVASLLVLTTQAQVPQPGLVPTVTETLEDIDPAQPLVDVFHGLATPESRLPYMDKVAGINDIAQEDSVENMDVTLSVSATTTRWGGLSGFVAGQQYGLSASGVYAFYKAGWEADAECSRTPSDPFWRPTRYPPDLTDLVLSEEDQTPVHFDWTPADPWPAGSGHDPACSRDHNYTATYTAGAPWVRFQVDDPQMADNVGSLLVRVTGGAPQYTVYYQCPKWAIEPHSGSRTVGELENTTLLVDSRRNANDRPYPKDYAPHVQYYHENGHNGFYTCNWLVPWETYDITVRGTYTYASPHPFNDPAAIIIKNDPTYQLWWWLKDLPELDLDPPMADAECSQGLFDPAWLSHREHHAFNDFGGDPQFGTDYFDLTLNELWVKWFPASGGDSGCDPDHEYVIRGWSPDRVGPLHLWIKDERYAENNNVGLLEVTIERV